VPPAGVKTALKEKNHGLNRRLALKRKKAGLITFPTRPTLQGNIRKRKKEKREMTAQGDGREVAVF